MPAPERHEPWKLALVCLLQWPKTKRNIGWKHKIYHAIHNYAEPKDWLVRSIGKCLHGRTRYSTDSLYYHTKTSGWALPPSLCVRPPAVSALLPWIAAQPPVASSPQPRPWWHNWRHIITTKQDPQQREFQSDQYYEVANWDKTLQVWMTGPIEDFWEKLKFCTSAMQGHIARNKCLLEESSLFQASKTVFCIPGTLRTDHQGSYMTYCTAKAMLLLFLTARTTGTDRLTSLSAQYWFLFFTSMSRDALVFSYTEPWIKAD